MVEHDLNATLLTRPSTNRGDVGEASLGQSVGHRVAEGRCAGCRVRIHELGNNPFQLGVPSVSVEAVGQTISVEATPIGNSAVFSLDRSLTGQDGISYLTSPDSTPRPPDLLASRLFAADTEVRSVHVLSNTVTVIREQPWSEPSLTEASKIIANLFVYYSNPIDPYQALRDANYNATITSIRIHNPELWIFRVRPDSALEPYRGGQYTTLGLGYWEPRADDASEDFGDDPQLVEKLARRSYSISSSIIDADGNLMPPHPEELEFYVVQVRPSRGPDVPGLTPRIFSREVGDRMYLGRKITGRYTLDGVKPDDNVVFLSTGTGEAPQNAMIAELLRNQHRGQILSVVCVRFRADLGYLDQQRQVENLYPNYKYVAVTTREPDQPKVYIQDMLAAGDLDQALGTPLDPSNTHVFLCGNPSMIGLPEWDGDTPTFPETIGVCQLLTERGFTVDHHKTRGNVHYEEYW